MLPCLPEWPISPVEWAADGGAPSVAPTTPAAINAAASRPRPMVRVPPKKGNNSLPDDSIPNPRRRVAATVGREIVPFSVECDVRRPLGWRWMNELGGRLIAAAAQALQPL